MTTATHSSQQVADGIHGIIGLGPYANEAARLGASVASTDIGRTARQTDTGAIWELLKDSPMRWQQLSGPLVVHTESTTARTLGITDANVLILCTSGSATTITVPLNASVPFSVGDVVLVKQGGAGQVTIAGASPPTLHARSSLLTKGQYSVLALTYEGSDVWGISGDEQ